ncbi:MAG: hypothetical protein KDN20_15325 [Verrucomicrobiae bacterium]|nr:hypothetical protein [Verrucomicrobiae bacterium]
MVIFAIIIGSAFAAFCQPSSLAAGYDTPSFSRPIVEVDALSLDSAATDELATALTALASNFADEPQVDFDVQEKALILALTLRPLDPDARSAHARLSRGQKPNVVNSLSNIGAVSEVLWNHAEKLAARNSEPEDQRLAPMLMELALLAHPGKAPDHQRLLFQRACEMAPLNWNQFLTLQPDVNPSNAKSISLFRPVKVTPPEPKVANAKPPKTSTTPPPPTNGAVPAMTTPPDPDDKGPAVSEIKLPEVQITYLALDEATNQPVGGTASLKVRDPSEDESSLFGLFVTAASAQSFEMRLTYDREGPVVAGTDRVENLIRKSFPRWPSKKLAEFSFSASAVGSAPAGVNLSLPALVMLGSAFSGDPINEAFAPAREFALTGELGRSRTLGMPTAPKIPAFAKAAAAMPIPPKALFFPDPDDLAEAQLLDSAATGDLSVLFRPQLVVFQSIESLEPLVFGTTPPELAAAIEDFGAIQNLIGTMEMDSIARNSVVQERLRGILTKWPGHLSARALLTFGTQPVDLTMSAQASVDSVQKILKPVSDHYESVIGGTGGGVVGATTPLVDEAMRALSDLRTKIDPTARPFLLKAEDTLDAFKVYLSLSNRESSIGQQRHRELQEEINALRLERDKLGIGTTNPD